MELVIELAEKKDLTAVTEFLSANDLPVSDLTEENVQLYIASFDGEIVATIGLEKYRSMGLLRSLAVKSTFRNQELAGQMIKGFFSLCESENITDVYLLTTTADKYFSKKGFLQVQRESVPPVIRQTREFKSICPASAVVMHRKV